MTRTHYSIIKRLILFIGIILLSGCTPEMIGTIEKELRKCQPREDVAVWTDGVIPYHFSENMPDAEKITILSAINWYEENTVLDFVEIKDPNIFFSTNKTSNGVFMKYTGSVQSGYFPYGMGEWITDFRVGKDIHIEGALHELGHVIGLPHEHQRADRDESIIVYEDNIDSRAIGNFKISDIDFVTPFDPTSIMMYDWNAYAIDVNKPTLEMIDGREIKPSKLPTQLDLEKIDELYCYEVSN